MTTNDKTGDKLVASIRKSKSGVAGSKPAPAPTSGRNKKVTATKSDKEQQGSYSYGRRVWPD